MLVFSLNNVAMNSVGMNNVSYIFLVALNSQTHNCPPSLIGMTNVPRRTLVDMEITLLTY